MEDSAKKIIIEKLKADLRIEEARLKAKRNNAFMVDGGEASYQIEISIEVINEISLMLRRLEKK